MNFLLEKIQEMRKLDTFAFNKLVGVNFTNISLSYIAPHDTDLHIAPHAFHRIPYEIENLQILRLPHYHKVDEQTVKLIIQKCALLQVLSLRGMEDISDICFVSVENAINCKSLRELDLLGCKNITDRSLVTLAEHCFHNLEKLCLKGCYQFDENTIKTAILSCTGKKMQKLVLAACEEITDEVVNCIGKMCPDLKYLDLSWCDNITDTAFVAMVNQVNAMESIRLRKTLLSDVSIQAIATAYNSHLLKLDICLCDNITSNALVHIYTNCAFIESFHFSWIFSCTNSDIQNLLLKCPYLKILKLEGCKSITSEGLECLTLEKGSRPPVADSLKLLDLRWCNLIDTETIASIRRSCPQLSILDYYGQIE